MCVCARHPHQPPLEPHSYLSRRSDSLTQPNHWRPLCCVQEKKELTKEQLLQYIKKLKARVKEVEGELATCKQAQAAAQASQVELEERAASLAAEDEAAQGRLVQAAERLHTAEARGRELEGRLAGLQEELAAARRGQDAATDAVERAKRAETELRRAEGRARELEAEVARLKVGLVGQHIYRM